MGLIMKLEISHVSKNYGNIRALSDVSFSVDDAQIVGIVGRNGAGKSTLLKLIMNILPCDTGNIKFFNDESSGRLRETPKRLTDKMTVGFLPEERGLYLNCTVKEQLLLFAELNGLSKRQAITSIEKYLERLGIPQYLNVKIRKLSKGNKQKIQLISALIHEPALIILDEPFSGLDPVNILLFREVVRNCKQTGRIMMFSSHRLEDVEQLCDYVIFIDKGTVYLQGCVNDIKKQFDKSEYRIQTEQPIEALLNEQDLDYGMPEDIASGYTYMIYEKNVNKVKFLIESIACQRLGLKHFEKVQLSLYEIFVNEFGEFVDEKEK